MTTANTYIKSTHGYRTGPPAADCHYCNCIKPPERNHPKPQKYQTPAKSASLHRAHSIFFSSSLRCSSALPLLSSIFSWLLTRFGDWRDSPVPGLQFFHFFSPPHYSSWSRFGVFNLSPFSPPPEASPTPNSTSSSLLTRRNLQYITATRFFGRFVST